MTQGLAVGSECGVGDGTVCIREHGYPDGRSIRCDLVAHRFVGVVSPHDLVGFCAPDAAVNVYSPIHRACSPHPTRTARSLSSQNKSTTTRTNTWGGPPPSTLRTAPKARVRHTAPTTPRDTVETLDDPRHTYAILAHHTPLLPRQHSPHPTGWTVSPW